MEAKTQFDYTSLSTFQTCRRKYDFRHNQGLVRKFDQTAPSFGKSIHLALNSWYVDHNIKKAIDIFKADYIENIEIDDKRTHKMGEWILNNYDNKYRDQNIELIENEKTFEIDVPGQLAFPNNKFIGRIDKIIKWNGCLWIMDHKTTSQLGATYFYMAEPNLQFLGYAWAARKLGYEIKGVLVDAILVAKGLLPGTSKNNNLTPLARYDIYYKQEQFIEWEETVFSIIRDIHDAEEHNEWYPNFNSCTDFGECPYRRICKEDKEIRPRIIEADFKVEYWNPLDKDPT